MFVSILLFVPFAIANATNDTQNLRCNDDGYFLEHTEECEKQSSSNNSAQKVVEPNGGNPSPKVSTQQTDEYVEDKFTECASGNIEIFLNRVRTEKTRITDAINNISKVEAVTSIVNLCGVTLKRLEESIATIRKADMSGLLTQATETSECFVTISAWIEARYGKSPQPPLDTIKASELIKVDDVKKAWELELKKLVGMQKERSAELVIYEQLRQLHSKSCLDDSPKPEGQ
jgi:hypothetical protein